MIQSDNYRTQLKLLSGLLIRIYAVIVALLVGIGLLAVIWGVDIGELTRDPIHKTGLHPFVGFLSNLGVLLWSFAAAICIFSAIVLRRSGRGRDGVTFYAIAGAITTWLMLDDLFLFHDVVLREYLGVSELIVYPVYALGSAAFFYSFRSRVLNSEYVVLVLALGFFAASMLVDVATDRQAIAGSYLFEDGFKFMGIVAWLAYFARTGFTDVMAAIGSGRRARMRDGVCSRCGSANVAIRQSQNPTEVPQVPLSAVHRYEKPAAIPLRNNQLSVHCNDCGYSEFYLSDVMKLVSVSENSRKVG